MIYIIDRPIMNFILEERARCVALMKALLDEPELLMYCIENAYGVAEIDTARQRFNELSPALIEVADDFEDLM